MALAAGAKVPSILRSWSPWLPLRGAGSNRQVPALPGLYRVRRTAGQWGLDYIGQTGRSLRGRLSQLNVTYRAEMPYADPHTAAPALWAMRHGDGCDFEASVVVVTEVDQIRRALEATAITLYRMESGRSPAANFGRMPAVYRKSTGNNAQLAASGRRMRGGPDPLAPHAVNSAPVSGVLGTDPEVAGWMGWAWSPWMPVVEAAQMAVGTGLYRLCRTGASGLVYVGQGGIAGRLRSHWAKATRQGHPQAPWFTGDLAASWVELPGMAMVNLLENENDLIASHVLALGRAPWAQFLGDRIRP
jgi:hypothetical protein